MAWVTPTAFVVDEVLTAAKLNQLVDAVAFLNGLSSGPTPPFPVVKSADNVAVESNYYMRHRSRYLHVVTWHDGANRLIIDIAGVQRHNAAPAAGYVDTVIDMNSFGLTVNSFVSVEIEIRADTSKDMSLLYVTELSSSGSLV